MDAHIQHNSDGFVAKLPVASQMIESKGQCLFNAFRDASLAMNDLVQETSVQ